MNDRRWWILAGIVLPVLVLDVLTKWWALAALEPGHTHRLLGMPITLAFNTGAAFSIGAGPEAARWFFIVFKVVALGVIWHLARTARPGDWLRLAGLGLLAAGTLGNLVDRVRWAGGVVDFIGPVNLGFMYWPIFNIADSAITCSVALLAVSFWREDARQAARATQAGRTEA
jgi:signal peptidase II